MYQVTQQLLHDLVQNSGELDITSKNDDMKLASLIRYRWNTIPGDLLPCNEVEKQCFGYEPSPHDNLLLDIAYEYSYPIIMDIASTIKTLPSGIKEITLTNIIEVSIVLI